MFKTVFSFQGLVLLIALVALGLSIGAIVKNCNEKFGNGKCVGEACDSSMLNQSCTTDKYCQKNMITGTGRKCSCDTGSSDYNYSDNNYPDNNWYNY